MMKGNKREDYRSARTWLAALKRDELWSKQMIRIVHSDRWDLYKETEDVTKSLYDGIPNFYWKLYKHDTERVKKVVDELWACDDLPLWRIQVLAICFLTLEFLNNTWGTNTRKAL